jgi:hypothetical protein
MDVTVETPEQTRQRLTRVLAQARLTVHEGWYCFDEQGVQQFPMQWVHQALALVRDEAVWSALLPVDATDAAVERFGVFSFHFPPKVPNSGFVGWLASELKMRLGTGVFVICGHNRNDGGVFDYWGVPELVFDQALKVLNELRAQGSSA